MSILKYAVLGTLGLAALAITTPGTAEASMTNKTVAWCKPTTASDQIIVADGQAALVFKPDGNLVLQSQRQSTIKIWSSGPAGTGAKVCWETNGTLAVYDAGGAQRWSKSGGSVPAPSSTGTYEYRLAPSLSQCDLSARFSIYMTASPSPFPSSPSTWPAWDAGGSSGTLVAGGAKWTRPATCPVLSSTTVVDDWCFDNSVEREILQGPWSRLLWKPGGFLVLLGAGSHDGEVLWQSPTAGRGKQLCFEPNGRLVIFDQGMQPVWHTDPDTTTTSSHLLGLDDCALNIKSVEATAPLWTFAKRCPQATTLRHWELAAGPSDQVVLENDVARLMFQADGNLVLRSAGGDEVWHSGLPAGRGKRLAFQDDGNLVIYDAANVAAWSAKMWGQGIALLELDGCSFSLKTWTETQWTRGAATCPGSAVTNTPAWLTPVSGVLTILRTPEARLVLQGDGSLVLQTKSGATVWSTNTGGLGKALSFQPDGNLVVYRTPNTDAASEAVWSSGTWYTGGASHALRLGDHCTLTITDLSGTTVKKTLNDSCTVVNYTFERLDGNSTLGVGMRTHLTAKDNGTARLDSTTGVDVTIFGASKELLSASGYQTETDDGSDLGNFSLAIDGESSLSVNVVPLELTFFEMSKTFNVGPVPVFVSASATGGLGLQLSFSGGTLTLTPAAGLYATVEAGVGGECDIGGARAGIRGTVTLIELSLPISLKLYMQDGEPRYTIQGDLVLDSLSGELSLFAEAYVKICFVKVSAEWSRTLFSWDGIEWSKNLFSKSGTF